jgi:hypothetical protein
MIETQSQASHSLDPGTWRLAPETFRRLMRQHRRTIRMIAGEAKITMKRVRQLRNTGSQGTALRVDEAIWLASGIWPTREQRNALAKRVLR